MTEPVPGIRPTPNQMEGRARRRTNKKKEKKKKENREGTLGVTPQAGGAGPLPDDDVGHFTSGLKFRRWRDLRVKRRIQEPGAKTKKFCALLQALGTKKCLYLANANGAEVDLWKERLASASRTALLTPPPPSESASARARGRLPVRDCFPTPNNAGPVAPDKRGLHPDQMKPAAKLFWAPVKRINASQQKQRL